MFLFFNDITVMLKRTRFKIVHKNLLILILKTKKGAIYIFKKVNATYANNFLLTYTQNKDIFRF